MPTETQSHPASQGRAKRILAKFGVGLLIFYTIKGILWLVVPAAVVWWSANR